MEVVAMSFLVPLSRTSMFCFLCCYLVVLAFSQDQPRKKDEKRIWTNDDLRHLAARPVENATGSSSSEDPSQVAKPEKHYVRTKDVRWYASQLKPLNVELEGINAQLHKFRQARKDGRGTVGALALDQDPEGITTDAQIQILEQHRTQVLQRIDELEDQARRNGLAPGDVRSQTTLDTPHTVEPDSATAGSGQDDPEIAEAEKAVQSETEHLKRVNNEKDLLQRNLVLQRRQLTSNPEFITRHVGDSKLASAENEIKGKDDEIQSAQQRLADLQDHLEDLKLNPRHTALGQQRLATGSASKASAPNHAKSEADWRKEFSEMHYKIRMAQSELDILQRELNVSLIQYDPNPAKAMRESITRRQINERRKKIDDKKAEVSQLKQQESDMEDELRHAGGDAGWARD